MSAFIANQPNPAPSTLDKLDPLPADGDFFPAVDMNLMRKALRIDGTVTPERMRNAAIAAQMQLSAELKPLRSSETGLSALWQLDLLNRGTPLAEKPTFSRPEELYFRAIVCLTGAELTDRYRSFDSTAEGNKRANVLEETIGNLRRDARWAIRDLLGRTRTTVELI